MLPDEVQREKFLRDLADMETMIGATLDFLRGEARKEASAQLDINALLSTLRDDMEALGETVEVSGEALQPLRARPQALKRCLANLLENAVRYGGKAHVRMEDHAHELLLYIEDSGPGIPEPMLEQMFEPFRRGEDSRNRDTGGVGLGLAIARNLARAHGGEVTLANRPEGGLRVRVCLPREN
jgi:signal transduction histidine kinase